MVTRGDGRTGDDDLADLALGYEQVVGPGGDCIVGYANYAHVRSADWPADANATALLRALPRVAQDFVAADRSDGERFGRAVGSKNLRIWRKELRHAFDDTGGNRGAGGSDAPQRGEPLASGDAPLADAVEQRRRAEQIGDAEVVDGLRDLGRIDAAGTGEVHFRDDRGHAERGA